MMATEDFINTSIFQGWIQFTCEGSEYRFEKKGCGVYHVFELIGNNCFHCIGRVKMRTGRPSTRQLYDAFLEPGETSV